MYTHYFQQTYRFCKDKPKNESYLEVSFKKVRKTLVPATKDDLDDYEAVYTPNGRIAKIGNLIEKLEFYDEKGYITYSDITEKDKYEHFKNKIQDKINQFFSQHIDNNEIISKFEREFNIIINKTSYDTSELEQFSIEPIKNLKPEDSIYYHKSQHIVHLIKNLYEDESLANEQKSFFRGVIDNIKSGYFYRATPSLIFLNYKEFRDIVLNLIDLSDKSNWDKIKFIYQNDTREANDYEKMLSLLEKIDTRALYEFSVKNKLEIPLACVLLAKQNHIQHDPENQKWNLSHDELLDILPPADIVDKKILDDSLISYSHELKSNVTPPNELLKELNENIDQLTEASLDQKNIANKSTINNRITMEIAAQRQKWFSKYLINEINVLIKKLQSEIDSWWPYPSKNLKRIKIDALLALKDVEGSQALDRQSHVEATISRFPKALEGDWSNRTKVIFDLAKENISNSRFWNSKFYSFRVPSTNNKVFDELNQKSSNALKF